MPAGVSQARVINIGMHTFVPTRWRASRFNSTPTPLGERYALGPPLTGLAVSSQIRMIVPTRYITQINATGCLDPYHSDTPW